MAYLHEGDEILVNTTTAKSQGASKIVTLDSGNYLVIWSDDALGRRGQLFDPDGDKIGAEFSTQALHAAAIPGGGFVAVWGDSQNVFAQIHDGSGAAVGSPFMVNTTMGNQYPESIAALASGGFVITWADLSSPDNSHVDVRAQMFGADGSRVGTEFVVNQAPESGFHLNSEVKGLAGGGFVVTWENAGEINAQIFSSAGARLGAEFQVNSEPGKMTSAQVAALSGGGFAIVWTEDTQLTGPEPFKGIHAQIFEASGARVGGELLIAAEGPEQGISLDAAPLATGGFVITWATRYGNVGDGSGTVVKAQVVDALGNEVGGELIVNSSTAGDQIQPVVTGLPSGDFVISWTDPSQSGGDTDGLAIRSQRFTAAGEIEGTSGDDYLRGTANDDEMFGLAGDDELFGLAGDDELNGGDGSDRLDGGSEDDVLRGQAGDDVLLVSGPGDDRARGGSGEDTLIVDYSGSTDKVEITDCLSWNEDLGGFDGAYGNWSGRNVQFTSIEHFVIGGGSAADEIATASGDDRILGRGGADTLDGGCGDDILDGGTGGDRMSGGAGNDIYYVDHSNDRVLEARAEGYDHVNSSVSFILGAHLERLALTGTAAIAGTGNGLANRIVGNGAANVLKGQAGQDSLDGGGGADRLYGGTSNDTLKGGTGADRFYFDTTLNKSNNVDRILDFVRADDTIFLDRDVFTGISANGTLAAGAFRLGTAAADSSDRILYDKASGKIFYDSDGAGGSAAVLFAQVTAGTTLTNADFVGYI